MATEKCGPKQQATASKSGPVRSQDEHAGRRQQRNHEPRCLKRGLVHVKDQEQDRERHQIEDRADQTEDHHEALNVFDVPALGLEDFGPDRRCRLEIAIDGMSERKLFRRICLADMGGTERRRERHAHHVPEKFTLVVIEIFECVGEGPPPVLYATAQAAIVGSTG